MDLYVRTGTALVGAAALAFAVYYASSTSFSSFPSASPQEPASEQSTDSHVPPTVSGEASTTSEKEVAVPDISPREFATVHENVAPSQHDPKDIEKETKGEDVEKKRLTQSKLYTIASERVVNLFCEQENNEVAIATGVIIHENGYILTNAHVADEENPRPCLIRSGSPARNFAIAERVFLPPTFSTKETSRENLAHDVAIWKITAAIADSVPDVFPSLKISPAYRVINGTPFATFSYPAELLGSHTVVSALYLSFSETIAQSHDAYFIQSTQGLGSQKGSSGGILIDPYTGEFAGLIFAINNTDTMSVSERTLFSLTPFAVNEAVRTTTGFNLKEYLDTNP